LICDRARIIKPYAHHPLAKGRIVSQFIEDFDGKTFWLTASWLHLD